MIINRENMNQLAWDKMQQLLPVIVQHHLTGEVLMQGYMSPEALDATFSQNQVTFYSRSKQRLWTKGESSGHTLTLVSVIADCDHDCLLVLAAPKGPTCHLGTNSCFPEQQFGQQHFLSVLEQVISQRATDGNADSYTNKLLARGTARVAQKVGEEGVEVALAAATGQTEELIGECADLFYHTLVLLRDQNISLATVMAELQRRHQLK